jgi:two-component system chemotaxis response regulator CheY
MTSSSSPSVLVVDDELFFREVLKKIFLDNGFNVVAEAADGDEAVRKFREFAPSLVVMDIYMPNKNGFEATKDIISIDPAAKILVCSGTGFDDDIDAALKSGASGLIFKPFYDEEVMETVRKILAS